MPGDQANAIALGGFDHAVALFQTECHGLVTKHLLSVVRCKDGVLSVKVVGCQDIHRIDIGTLAHGFDGAICLAPEFTTELVQCLLTQVRRGGDLYSWMSVELGQGVGYGRTKSSHSNSENRQLLTVCGHGCYSRSSRLPGV